MAAVHPKASAGMDGAAYLNWRKSFADAIRWPWFERTTDGTPPTPIVTPEPFDQLKAFAASGHAGCVKARARLRQATNRGLAAALGRDLPEALTR